MMQHLPLSDGLIGKFRLFLRVSEPWVSKFIGEEAAFTSSIHTWRQSHPEVNVLTLDGQRMGSADGFYDELTRGLSLPDYFGRNLNALNECLTDEDVVKGKAIVLLVRNAEKVLSDENPEGLDGFLDVLRNAGEEWASPVKKGEAWDRDATPFHAVVLVCEGGQSVLSSLPDFYSSVVQLR